MPCVFGGRYVVFPALINFLGLLPADGLTRLLLVLLLCSSEPETGAAESLQESAPAAMVASAPINEKDNATDKDSNKGIIFLVILFMIILPFFCEICIICLGLGILKE